MLTAKVQLANVTLGQDDQIGRIFSYSAIVYLFGHPELGKSILYLHLPFFAESQGDQIGQLFSLGSFF
jgi:hypothetical protein